MIWILAILAFVVSFTVAYYVVNAFLQESAHEETRRRNAQQTSEWLVSHPFRK